MNDMHELLARQAAWQQSRKNLPWPEKLRMVQSIRDSIKVLRAGRQSGAASRLGSDSVPKGSTEVDVSTQT